MRFALGLVVGFALGREFKIRQISRRIDKLIDGV